MSNWHCASFLEFYKSATLTNTWKMAMHFVTVSREDKSSQILIRLFVFVEKKEEEEFNHCKFLLVQRRIRCTAAVGKCRRRRRRCRRLILRMWLCT